MPDIAFKTAWMKNDPAIARDAKAFWNEIGILMTPEEMEQRTSELCAAAYANGKLVAVSTVHLFEYPRLGSRFFYYRTTVDPNLRRQRLAWRLCAFCYREMAAWARSHPEEKLKGLLITIEAGELFRESRRFPIISGDGVNFIFVGYAPSRQQIRVAWFANATIE